MTGPSTMPLWTMQPQMSVWPRSELVPKLQALPSAAWRRTCRKSGFPRNSHSRNERSAPIPLVPAFDSYPIAYDIF